MMEKTVVPGDTSINTNTLCYQGVNSNLATMLSGGCDWIGDGSNGNTPNSYSNSDRNITGFSALPAGTYFDDGYQLAKQVCYFWSASSYTRNGAIRRRFDYNKEGVSRMSYSKYNGFSVRCVRNN